MHTKRSPLQHLFRACSLSAALLLVACNSNDPAALMVSAREAMSKRDFNTATIHVKNVLQENPENGAARVLFGQILLAQRDAAGAVNELRKAQAAGHDESAVAPVLAQALVESGEAKKALDEFGGKQLVEPSAQARLSAVLGRASLAQGDIPGATRRFEAAVKALPDNPEAQLGLARVRMASRDVSGAMALIGAVLKAHADHIEARLLLGDVLLTEGKTDEALATFRQAASSHADDPRPLYKLVAIHASAGRTAEAGKDLAALRKIAPNQPQTAYFEAMLALRQNRFTEARDASAKVLRVAPDHLPSLVIAASANMRLGDALQAQTLLRRAVNLEPEWPVPRKLLAESFVKTRDADAALEALRPLLEGAQPDADVLNLAGQAYLVKGDFSRSTDFFSRVSAAQPASAEARTRLALARLASGDETRAMQDLEVATGMDSKSFQADLAIIATHMRRGDTAKAMEAVAALEKKQPDNPATHVIKGQALLAARDYPRARAAFERAVQLAPSDVMAAVQLARLDVAEGKNLEARKHFQSIIDKDGKNVRAYVLLAELMLETGADPKDVQATLDKAVGADPSRNEARLALVQFHLRRGNNKQALDVAQQAQAAQPDSPEVLRAFGRAQLAAGESQQAVSTFSRLQSLQPQSPAALLELADSQRSTGDLSSAEQTLRRALDMKPDFPEAQQRLAALLTAAQRGDEALRIARGMQKNQPAQAAGYVLEAQVLAQTKRWPEATLALQQAYQQVKSPQIVTLLHTAQLQQGKDAEAARVVDDWLRGNPKDVVVRTYLAERAMSARQYPQAVSQYKALLALQPDSPLVLNNLAWTANKIGDAKTMEYAEAALKAAPRSPEVMETVGTILVERGQRERGINLLRQAALQAPASAPIRIGYARGLMKSGDKSGARKELDAARQLPALNAEMKQEIDTLAATL